MPTDPYDLVLERLDGIGGTKWAKRTASTAVASCPSHQDKTPSLSVTRRPDKVLLHCHAGCSFEDILSDLRLEKQDLFADSAERQDPLDKPSVIVKSYIYTDAEGQNVFQVARMSPKSFRQRRWDGFGWKWGLGDTQRVLYRLPLLQDAIATGRWVIITEGEKDADRLIKEGFVATTNSGGAGKWEEAYTQSLAGALVVILPDNDPAGQDHATAVAETLQGVARAVKVLQLDVPEKGDVSDWLDAGGTADKLRALMKDTPYWDPAIAELAPSTGPQTIDWPIFWRRSLTPEWLVEPFLPLGRLVALYAQGKAGKSLIALEVACALATGQATLYQEAQEPMSVIYVDMEMTEDDLWERLVALGYNSDSDLRNLHYYQLQNFRPLDTEQGGAQLLEAAIEHGPQLIVIDTVARVIEGGENDADTYINLYRNSLLALKALKITVLRLDHSGKDPKRGQRGSSAKNDDVDVVWLLEQDLDRVTLKMDRRRMGWVPEKVTLERASGPLRHLPAAHAIPLKVQEIMGALDRLNISPELSRRKTQSKLKAHGLGYRADDLNDAIRERRRKAHNMPSSVDTGVVPENPEPYPSGTSPGVVVPIDRGTIPAETVGEPVLTGSEPVPEPSGTIPLGGVSGDPSGTTATPKGGAGGPDPVPFASTNCWRDQAEVERYDSAGEPWCLSCWETLAGHIPFNHEQATQLRAMTQLGTEEE
jgi:hypothetical protein